MKTRFSLNWSRVIKCMRDWLRVSDDSEFELIFSLSLSLKHSPGVERGVVVTRKHGFLGVGPDGEVHQRIPVIDLVPAQDVVLCPVGGFLVLSKHDLCSHTATVVIL